MVYGICERTGKVNAPLRSVNYGTRHDPSANTSPSKYHEQIQRKENRDGDISDLELQPKFDIVVNKDHICYYYADFEYVDSDGSLIYEDVKGVKTPVYRLKKKLVEALYGVKITEVQ